MKNERGSVMDGFADLIRKVRPAPLAAFIAQISGIDQRRPFSTRLGTFFINPVSNFGSQLLRGEYEPNTRSVLEGCLKPGSVFVDLGANEGYFSVVASKLVGPSGSVLAVEPQSRLQSIIHMNLYINECFNVRVVRTALSDAETTVELNLASEMNSGSTSLYRRSARYPMRKEAVKCMTLERLMQEAGLDRCDLMKVDVEGAEYDIFMAAGKTLRSGIIKNIALEFHEGSFTARGLKADDLHQWVLGCGYALNGNYTNRVYSFIKDSASK